MDPIKLVKHISGLELIGALCESTDDRRVILTSAFQVLTQQSGNQVQMSIVPICVTAEEANKKGLPAEFYRKDLIGIYTPNAALLEVYQRMIGSIITPQNNTPKLLRN